MIYIWHARAWIINIIGLRLSKWRWFFGVEWLHGHIHGGVISNRVRRTFLHPEIVQSWAHYTIRRTIVVIIDREKLRRIPHCVKDLSPTLVITIFWACLWSCSHLRLRPKLLYPLLGCLNLLIVNLLVSEHNFSNFKLLHIE